MKYVAQVRPGPKSGVTEFTPEKSALIAAGAVIAATYFYFLIYAEFALLELAKPVVGDEAWRLRGLMFALGAGGLIGSIWAAKRFNVLSLQARLSWSLRGCAVGAALALGSQNWALLLVSALVSGGALGALTVNLATSLRPVIGTSKLGWVIGWGTGLAYLLCNVPWVFEASPRLQTIMAAVVAASASVFSPFLAPQEPSVSPEREYAPSGLLRWVGVLLMLVWLDSAAFFVIQHEAGLKEQTWVGAAQLWGNGVVHLGLALLAGRLLDRGVRVALPVVAFALLAAGCLLLGDGGSGLAAWFYAAGVSLYSVVLVYYPARGGRAWQAAVVYGLAGWVGSALGIGMAQDLARVPGAFLVVAGVVIAVMVGWRWKALRAAAMVAVIVVGMGVVGAEVRAEVIGDKEKEVAVALGREVYIAEGCIHCHSQYLRPSVPAERAEAAGLTVEPGEPPLFGNRRQGPDLMAIGRRLPSADWHREHLRDPRKVRPGSRMPAYAYLFAEGDERGPALVAYLMSLGSPVTP
ncbi:cbb3-type cytochrome c oxidase subunit II [Actomonas aquatica]|uniref:Cbb3-type cytochrome c oxidase subunit II n=1 Tax=Actomonas aquatica TaxID=2866162 RepID=A0ABZ1C846_9BACT|nr:cbb3-type cytochrome c oxidase subunit II [Opitutus sp. WL0086]WRQ86475.1 cbb3-type cytochrome c oxidase subunit II [Opitutus sp. WL0086]